jgi:predicted O-linked N-acetylglucosamine transferase (SPINDLY family)
MNIVFVDLVGWDYDVATPCERPLGGSQSALCYLAVALARRGHQVTVLSDTSRPRDVHGVRCLSCRQVPPALWTQACDVVVALNGPAELPGQLRPHLNPASLRVLWTQHAVDQPAMFALQEEGVRREWDLIVCVSDWQRTTMIRHYHLNPDQVVVLGNAMAPTFEGLFRDGDELAQAKASRPVLAYTSTPFRGLEVLLATFPEVRRRSPDLELHVYSSMKVYQQDEGADPYRCLYERCRRTPGVRYFGAVAQPELAAALKAVSILSYPNTFAETSCIAVMEALAAGLLVVTSDRGALPETTRGFGVLVPAGDPAGGEPGFAHRYLARLSAVLQERAADPLAFAARRWEQVRAVNEHCTWRVRARQWEETLRGRRRAPPGGPSGAPTAVPPGAAEERAPMAPPLAGALTLALGHLQAGRLAEAEALCRQVLRAAPREAEAYRLLGVVAYHAGNPPAAVTFLQQAVALNPQAADYADNLSFLLHAQGRLAEAEAAARQALALQPGHVSAANNLANALQAQGRRGEAIAAYRQVLALQPDWPAVLNMLGNLLRDQGSLGEAEAAYRRALALAPGLAEVQTNLGNVLADQGRLEEAEQAHRRALELQPAFAVALNNLGTLLNSRGRCQEAEAAYRRALALQPAPAEAAYNLGNLLYLLDRMPEALQAYRQARQIKPGWAAAEYGVARTLEAQGQVEEAEQACRQALRLRPDYADVECLLGTLRKGQGLTEEAMAHFQRALRIDPGLSMAHGSALQCEHYRPGVSLAGLAAAHAEWDRRHAQPLRGTWRPFPDRRDPERRLRLGFVSADFRFHPVGIFLVRTLEALDRRQCETFGYANQLMRDHLTDRIAAAVGTWRQVQGLSDEQLTGQIRADGIDILFDLSGHTGGNRLLVFARKPAPLQVTWIGYVGTTGMTAMDYLLADRFHVPAGWEGSYREEVLRLPDGYICYDPPAAAPAVGPLPALSRGFVTFGSFNNPAKVTSPVVAVWAEILRRVPGSRLVLKFWGWDDRRTQQHFRERFAAHGIGPARLEFLGRALPADMLAHYRQVDLALDPFPYSGGLTTCEALWMGVPVVTCPGETFASRHALSHLSNVGLTETVTPDLSAYVERAVELARDRERLAALRAGLRERVRRSPLCDGVRFADNLQSVLRSVWRHWCARQG